MDVVIHPAERTERPVSDARRVWHNHTGERMGENWRAQSVLINLMTGYVTVRFAFQPRSVSKRDGGDVRIVVATNGSSESGAPSPDA